MDRVVHNYKVPASMRKKLLRLVLVVLVPLLVVQAGIYAGWYWTRWSEQEQATLDTAQEVAATFEAYVADVRRQEAAIGAALTGPHSYTTAEINHFLTVAGRDYPSIFHWSWTDFTGRVIASSQPKAVGLVLSVQPCVQELRRGRPWVVSDLLTDPVSGARAFVVASRINNQKGVPVGMVIASADLANLGSHAVALYHTVGEAIALFDRQGILVYNSAEQEGLFQDWRNDDPLLADALASSATQSGVIDLLVPDNDRKQYMASRVPIGEIGWVAGARRPTAKAMADVYTGLWIAGGLNLLVAIASGGLAWKTGGNLIRPLRQLQTHAQAIGRGDLAHSAESTDIRELAELAVAFNQMGTAVHAARKALETANSTLEQRVAQRTAELDKYRAHLEELVQQRTAQLEAASSQLQAVFDVVNVGILLIDEHGAVKRVNNTVSRWIGKDLSLRDYNQPGDVLGCVHALADSAGCGSTPHCENCSIRNAFQSVLHSGQSIHDVESTATISIQGHETHLWLEVSTDPVIIDGHRHVILALNNVTARKRAEEAVTWMASFPRLNPNPIVEVDLEGQVHYVNPFAEKLFPDLQQNGIAHPWLTDWESVARAVQEGDAQVRVREVMVDQRWYRQVVHYVKEIHRVRLYGLDITDRKQAEELLKHTADQLTRSNQELEQFAYIASHDLQEPLRVVIGYVQLIERKYKSQLDADADQFFHYIVDGVTRMQQLITDLLNYSRVGTRSAPFRTVSLQAVLDRVLMNLKAVVEQSGAAVTHDTLPSVSGDETQLVQLFQNLIGNGIKFHSDRPPQIHISARRDGTDWEFAVRDNGIGIEKQYFEQIFVIFQRLHTRQKYPGTGIGLAICKRIVERHGGRIWLDSQPGQGTTFYFTLS